MTWFYSNARPDSWHDVVEFDQLTCINLARVGAVRLGRARGWPLPFLRKNEKNIPYLNESDCYERLDVSSNVPVRWPGRA